MCTTKKAKSMLHIPNLSRNPSMETSIQISCTNSAREEPVAQTDTKFGELKDYESTM